MAAPIENVRVRLSFANIIGFPDNKPLKSWFLINNAHLENISDLQTEICHRFGLNEETGLTLYVDGFVLPSWESVRLVREGDDIRQVTKRENVYHLL